LTIRVRYARLFSVHETYSFAQRVSSPTVTQLGWDLEVTASIRARELLGRFDDDPILGFLHFSGFEKLSDEDVGTPGDWAKIESEHLAKEQYRLDAGLAMQPIKVRGRGPERIGNNRNGPKPRLTCEKDHSLTPENTYMRADGKGRECLTCRNLRNAARATGQPPGRPHVERCRNDHEMTEDNIYYYMRDGNECRACRKCRSAAGERRREKRKRDGVRVLSACPDQILDTLAVSV
jgi:hypothetical protein